ncbi:MAG: hypothetical protein E3K37_18115 [Candidatus Kuenenia sp.]|nr:hypothetical protein [Candidatus Kuenenia hertensis]
MRPVSHLGISFVAGAATYYFTRSIPPSIACFLIGWLIDVDHIWDYYINVGWDFSIKKFGHAVDSGKMKKAFLYFHSYELLIILIILCFFTQFNYCLSFTTLGIVIHLVCDQIVNPVKPLTYFLIYRVLKKFDHNVIFKIDAK